MERKFDWRTPVIAIDFDGTLCTDEYPEIGKPNEAVIQEAKALRENGVCLILWTCRAGKNLDAAVEACRSWGLEFDAVNENPQFRIDLNDGNDCRKVGADEYWDDKSVYVGTGEKGEWRHLHGIPTNRTPINEGLAKCREFIHEVLAPEIARLQTEATDWNHCGLLAECREYMELFLAELSEPPSIHSWFREGYKAATENAAHWFTEFLQETGMIEKEGDANASGEKQ